MLRLLRSILSADRKRRGLAVGLALRLLRLVRDIEYDEMYRYSDRLEELDLNSHNVSPRDYTAIEEMCSECECALGFLDSAIEDLEFAY